MPLLIPCHRVVRSDGRLGKYSMGGARNKRTLLQIEGAHPETLEKLASSGVRYLGNSKGMHYCYPTCGGIETLVESNTVPFHTDAEALGRGLPPLRRLPAPDRDRVVSRARADVASRSRCRQSGAGKGGRPGKLSEAVYNDFYGFREAPFNITPDPRFLFFSDKHREAFNHVLFGIRERKGFIQITGEVGAGKTTVCRAILAELGPSYQTALILNPMVTATQMMRTILSELGLEPRKLDQSAYLEILNRFLLDQAAAGNDVVLLIDESQDLDPELLEQVRLLSNLETDQRKLLQIVLIGQPELREKLNRKGAPAAPAAHHGALSPRAARPLRDRARTSRTACAWRAATAGRPFRRGPIRTIQRYSGGLPRLINAVCDKALLYGYVNGTYELRPRAVRQAIRELEGEAS